jgi:hypothetical protein
MLLASISKIVNTAKLVLGLGPDRQTLALQQAKDYQSQVLGTNTLQLTTFNPATNIQQKCSEVSFELSY